MSTTAASWPPIPPREAEDLAKKARAEFGEVLRLTLVLKLMYVYFERTPRIVIVQAQVDYGRENQKYIRER